MTIMFFNVILKERYFIYLSTEASTYTYIAMYIQEVHVLHCLQSVILNKLIINGIFITFQTMYKN